MAAIRNPLLTPELQNISGEDYFALIMPKIVGLALLFGSLTFFFMLVIGAISWIAAGGDKANLESARGRISNALIGLVVLFATFAIIRLVETFFNVDILKIDLGPLKIA